MKAKDTTIATELVTKTLVKTVQNEARHFRNFKA
jgi:hypothetical protein